MSSKALCIWVRVSVVAVACCGIFICAFLLPFQCSLFVREYPEAAYRVWPWLTFLSVVSLPCFAILGLIWKVSTAIKQDKVFTIQTAKLINYGAVLLFGDIGLFFAGNLVFAILGISSMTVVMASLFAIIFGIALAVFAAVLSRYITKAAILQEESEATI